MNKKNIIDQFVSSILEFKTDDKIIAKGPVIQTNTSYQMAAAGERTTTSMVKLGTLSNDDGHVMVRVFKDMKKKKYKLYFLSDDNRFSQFPILFEPTTFKYFIIHQDGHAEIPLSSHIDPVREDLSISYPIITKKFDLNKSDIEQEEDIVSISVKNSKLYVNIPEKSTKALLVFSDTSEKIITRLVPVRNGEVSATIPENIKPEITISIFD